MTGNKEAKQRQIEFIKTRLIEGKSRGEILREFTELYKTSEKTFDTRLKIAREEVQEVMQETSQQVEAEIQSKVKERSELIKRSIDRAVTSLISKLSLTKVETVRALEKTPDGREVIVERQVTVSALSARELKDIWAVLRTENEQAVAINKNENTIDVRSINVELQAKIEELKATDPEKVKSLLTGLEALAQLE